MRIDVSERHPPEGRQLAVVSGRNNRVQVRPSGEPEPVRRFRDLRDLLQRTVDFEVTNGAALELLLDVYALHAEQEGREDVAAAARRPLAADGGTVE